MTITLDESIEAFATDVLNNPTPDAVRARWAEEYARISPEKSESTLSQYARRYRKRLQEAAVDKALRDIVAIEEADDPIPLPPQSKSERIEAFCDRIDDGAHHGDIMTRKWRDEVMMMLEADVDNIAQQVSDYRDALRARDPDHPAIPYIAIRPRGENLQEEIDAFVVRAREAGTKKVVEELWKEELASIAASRTESTTKLYASKYRSAMQEAGLDFLGEVIKLQKRNINRLNHAYRKDIAATHRDLTLFREWRPLVETATDMLKSGQHDVDTEIMCLCLVTGRRPYEIAETATFEPYTSPQGTTSRSLVVFTGQTKTKGSDVSRDHYPIPVLMDARTVLKTHERLRASSPYQGLDNTTFNTKTAQKMKQRFVRYFSPFWPTEAKAQVRLLRALYAEVCYHEGIKLPDAQRLSKNAYFSAILGHSADDVNTSLSYMKYELPEGS